MAEIQKTSFNGEMTQRFIEFVMMQSQHAALFLGQIPNPETGQASVNLEAARMFINQLEMIGDKTRGNLTSEESKILTNALTNLQMVYMELSGDHTAYQVNEEPELEAPSTISSDTNTSSENKKRFTKSYGS